MVILYTSMLNFTRLWKIFTLKMFEANQNEVISNNNNRINEIIENLSKFKKSKKFKKLSKAKKFAKTRYLE